MDFGLVDQPYHCNLPRLRQSGLTAFCNYVGARDLALSLELWDALLGNVDRYPEDFALVRTADDITRAKQDRRIGLIAQLESCACLGNRLGGLNLCHRLGLRVANLTHGEGLDQHPTSLQTDGSVFDYVDADAREVMRREMRGLTDFGRDVVKSANEMGIVVDLAHANDRTFYDALELSTRPCIFSHGGVFAVCPHSRGLTDDQIRALAASGGVMGVACYDKFIHREEPSMDRLMDQVVHVIDLVGPDHVGLGTDFDGLGDEAVPIPPHVGRLADITAAMVARGLGEGVVRQVLGGNYLRVFGQVWG